MSQKSKAALYRYLTKVDKGEVSNADEGEEIDPSFLEVEKVMDCREEEVTEQVVEATNQAALNELQKLKDEEQLRSTALSKSTLSKERSLVSDDGLSMEESAVAVVEGESAEGVVETKPGSRFNPVERCLRVLDKILEDPYSTSFKDPVDTDTYTDYLDVVEEPICLSDIRRKLEKGDYNKYMAYRQFAQDMRKVWRNCKQYNDYHSSIWLCANYLSIYFERLYQAWVMSFMDGSISLAESIGRPWESSCRTCLKENNDDQILLCDHCDAAFHVYCLRPPLASVPEDAWMCRRCLKWLAKSGAKVLSATAEEEARNMVDGASSRKTIRVKRKKYLVKWRGLSYRECTWETKEDIGEDDLIAEYHLINDSPPDEPPLTQAEIGVELAKDRKSQIYPAGYQQNPANPVVDLDAQIYAQIRSYHFLKWQKTTPTALLKESGPHTHSFTYLNKVPMKLPPLIAASVLSIQEETAKINATTGSTVTTFDRDAVDADSSPSYQEKLGVLVGTDVSKDTELLQAADALSRKTVVFDDIDPYREVVGNLLSDMVYSVARDSEKAPLPVTASRPPLPSRFQIPSEVEICVPKGQQSFCMRIGNFNNNVVVMGFKPDKNGRTGPIERTYRVKIGDFLVAINGVYIFQWKYEKIALYLASLSQPYVYLRFLRVPRCVESRNPDVVEMCMSKREANLPLTLVSKDLYPIRSRYFGVFPAEDGSTSWEAYFYRGQLLVFVGRYDDETEAARAYDTAVLAEDDFSQWTLNFTEEDMLTDAADTLGRIVQQEREHNSRLKDSWKKSAKQTTESKEKIPELTDEMIEKEIDGFHSDDSMDSASEDGDEENSQRMDDEDELPDDHVIDDDEEEVDDDDDEDDDDEDEDDEEVTKKNGNNSWKKRADQSWGQNDKVAFDEEGPIGRLLRAVNECAYPPIRSDWTKYVLELGLESQKKFESSGADSNVSSKGRWIEQIDLASNQVIRTWKSMLAAAKALSIPVAEIYNSLRETRDSAGGFKWKYGDEIPVEVDPDDPDGQLADERKDDSWQLKLPTKSKEYKNGNTLRDYQVEGLNWLLRCWYLRRSSILADEMGLGKTAQVVSFLDHLYEVENIKGPFLICVPLSTIGHWLREVGSWSNMRCCVYHDAGGGRDMRDIIREYDWYYKGRSRRLLKFHVLVTTYDDLVRDYEELAEVPWRAVIVDEAHRLKNIHGKLLDCVRTVSIRGQAAYGYQHRVLMTGTPLQNNTLELWSLLNFIEPAKFPDLEKFQQRFGNIKTQEQVELLQRRIAPHILRRVKEDVATDIPPKEETIIDVELTTMQKQYYRAIFEHNHAFLMQNTKGNVLRLMNIQMELRKCCNHPFLINGVEIKEMENLEGSMEDEAESNRVSSAARSKLLFDNNEFERRRMETIMIPASGKMVLLDKLLPKLRNEGHKVRS